MDICGDNRFEIIAKAKAHLLDATNIDTSPKEMEVLDDFLFRCWQMGWLDRYDRKTEPSNSEIPNNCEEPQYEMGMGTLKCDNCSEYGSFKCTKCDGEMYFKRLEPKDEPQTCEDCKHNGEKHAYDYACDKCTDMDKFQHEDELQTQLTAKCLNCNNSKVCKEKHWDGCVYEPIEDEPQTEVIMPKKCKGCDSASKIIEAYSRGFEDGAEAVKAMPQAEKHKCRRCLYYDISSDYYPCSECVDYSNYSGEIEDEPQTDCAGRKGE